jgi:iron complex outermembrane receptor protein
VRASQNLSLNLFAEPKVLRRSERGTFRDFTRYHVGASGTWEVRARISSTLESRTALGGDEAYQDGAIQFYNLDAEGNRGDTLRANQREGANSAGGFIEQELTWNERWSARVAVRYDNMHYISEDRMDPSLNATQDFSQWTPKGSLSYRFDDHTVYASLGGGVEAPAFNEIDPPPPFDATTSLNPFLEPMHSTTYEAGAKGAAPQLGRLGRVRYDAALYWIDVKNDIIPYDGGAYFLTAGKSRRRGLELGLDWLPVRGLLIEAGATFSNNEYLEYTNNLGNFAGKDVAGLPPVTVSARARYEAPRGFSPEIRVESVGSCYADDANTAKAPGYTIVGASLGYGAPIAGGTLRVYVAGDNLTDKAHVASVFINGTGGRYYEPGLPRNWSAGLTFKFQ